MIQQSSPYRSPPRSGTGNRLIDRLPEDEYEWVLTQSETVSLPRSEELYREPETIGHLYFPTTAVLSTVIEMEDGRQVEACTVGSEGMVGIDAYLGLLHSTSTALSQIAGQALRVPAQPVTGALRPGSALDRLLRRYTSFALRKARQTVACNALHPAEERICRWLLTVGDSAGNDEFLLTHEYLAAMLGVRRQTVSLTAATIQQAGLISYRRGALRLLDRKGLEACSCECYQTMTKLYASIMR